MCIAGAAMGLGGCSGDAENEAAAVAPAPAPSAAVVEARQSAVGIEKWNTYVDLHNAMLDRFYPSIEIYFKVFGNEAAFRRPARENDRINFTNSTLNSNAFIEAIDLAINLSVLEPSDHLDLAAANLALPLKDLWADMRELTAYFRGREYAGDSYAKAEQIHTRILAVYQEVEAAFPVFLEFLSAQEAARRENDIARMRIQGYKVLPAMLAVLTAADDIHIYFVKNEISSDTLIKLNKAAFSPFCDRLEAALKALEEVMAKEAAEKEGLDFNEVEVYCEAARQVRDMAAGVIDGHLKQQRVEALAQGSPESFNQEFNVLVKRYNSSIF
jgi:hypothetical protein